jgi:cellulose synthase/poly-beta-1,6-N-acetylglucosamine synthase-like glycosyltransferase
MYGTMTEDILTGLTIHKKGWRSELCTPEPIAFTGCAPIDGPTCMAQHKRWATGMLEIFFSKHCPIFAAVFGKLSFRQFLAYMWIMNWGFGPVAQVCYACLLAYCIITNCYFLPKVSIEKHTYTIFPSLTAILLKTLKNQYFYVAPTLHIKSVFDVTNTNITFKHVITFDHVCLLK